MNNTIKLAVASALFAAASSANAGIMIPAGDWTLDIGGVVNAYYTSTRVSGSAVNGTGTKTASNITTGLLPNYLSVSGKTRQNDLDVGFTISINPGAAGVTSGYQGAGQENRQAFLTFGDASWGSVKLGKDLGIYASDAILNDMTLLGVGRNAGALSANGNTTTLGAIGAGYMYADWKSQIAYSSPNWNGFSFTAGVTQALGGYTTGTAAAGNLVVGRGGSQPAFEGKASYAWAGDVAGKVWVSGITQNLETSATTNERVDAWDIGGTVSMSGFGLTGYYGQGSGTGSVVQMSDVTGQRDSEDWYLQGTYTIPTVGTKLGARYGESSYDTDATGANDTTTEMWTIGAYHPLTKHLNLVAEYTDVKFTGSVANFAEGKQKTVTLGAILFF
jgi:predicted porin